MANRLVWMIASLGLLSACVGEVRARDAEGESPLSGTAVVCKTLQMTRGAIGEGQSASALAAQDQSGKQDNWNKYIEFSPGSSGVCTFPLPAGMTRASLASAALRVSYRGPKKSQMRWTFEAAPSDTSSFQLVGDNAFAADWKWSSTSFDVPLTAVPVSAGSVLIRYGTTSGADASDVDALVLTITPAHAVTDAGTSPPVDAGTPPPPPVDAGTGTSGSWWKPSNTTPMAFHWELSPAAGEFTYPNDVVANEHVYDIDGDATPAATVAQLHSIGAKVICYLEVGSVENYRSDYQEFVAAGVVGKAMQGWPGEFWIDITNPKVIPLIQARFQTCKEKGFDAIEPDTSEVWDNNSGFKISQAQNDAYNIQIANMAHALGLSIGLKNNPDAASLKNLAPYYDWALNEQCFEYSECGGFTSSFLAAGKAVWDVEYNVNPTCSTADGMKMNALRRDLDLVGPHDAKFVYQPCEADGATAW